VSRPSCRNRDLDSRFRLRDNIAVLFCSTCPLGHVSVFFVLSVARPNVIKNYRIRSLARLVDQLTLGVFARTTAGVATECAGDKIRGDKIRNCASYMQSGTPSIALLTETLVEPFERNDNLWSVTPQSVVPARHSRRRYQALPNFAVVGVASSALTE
jgi:hypothetical protein